MILGGKWTSRSFSPLLSHNLQLLSSYRAYPIIGKKQAVSVPSQAVPYPDVLQKAARHTSPTFPLIPTSLAIPSHIPPPLPSPPNPLLNNIPPPLLPLPSQQFQPPRLPHPSRLRLLPLPPTKQLRPQRPLLWFLQGAVTAKSFVPPVYGAPVGVAVAFGGFSGGVHGGAGVDVEGCA